VADLQSHSISVAVFRPQIAPNVGNIARTCVAAGARLHLIRPYGFVLDDKQLKRSSMDYWPRLMLTQHDDEAAFFKAFNPKQCWFFDSEARHDLFDVPFLDGDVLCMGSETRGIDPAILKLHDDRTVRIPQAKGERCMNLATSTGIALYVALAKIRR
jgi:tRNA (cytidine/uridine-2'-O-)-methyltransferase